MENTLGRSSRFTVVGITAGCIITGTNSAGARANLDAKELARCDADDGKRHAAEPNLPADDRSIAAEAALPVAMTENGDRVPERHAIVVGAEQPSDRGADAEQRKILAGYQLALRGRLDRPVDVDVQPHRGVRREGEDVGVIANQLVLLVGEAVGDRARSSLRERQQVLRIAEPAGAST